MRRLEEITGAVLFTRVGRKLVLTDDGEIILGYARTIMGLQNELRARLAAPKLNGQFVLGTPDLYAAYLLPAILSDFRRAYPNVNVELRCALSSKLMGAVERAEIDLALVTGMPAFKGGELVAQEPLVWVTAENSSVHGENPVPPRDAAAWQYLPRLWACSAGEYRPLLAACVHQRKHRRVAGRSIRRHRCERRWQEFFAAGNAGAWTKRKFSYAAKSRPDALPLGTPPKSSSRSDGQFYCAPLCQFRAGTILARCAYSSRQWLARIAKVASLSCMSAARGKADVR